MSGISGLPWWSKVNILKGFFTIIFFSPPLDQDVLCDFGLNVVSSDRFWIDIQDIHSIFFLHVFQISCLKWNTLFSVLFSTEMHCFLAVKAALYMRMSVCWWVCWMVSWLVSWSFGGWLTQLISQKLHLWFEYYIEHF
jgi:hypothetical protein